MKSEKEIREMLNKVKRSRNHNPLKPSGQPYADLYHCHNCRAAVEETLEWILNIPKALKGEK